MTEMEFSKKMVELQTEEKTGPEKVIKRISMFKEVPFKFQRELLDMTASDLQDMLDVYNEEVEKEKDLLQENKSLLQSLEELSQGLGRLELFGSNFILRQSVMVGIMETEKRIEDIKSHLGIEN